MDVRTVEAAGQRTFYLSGRLTYRDNESFAAILAQFSGLARMAAVLDLSDLEYLDSFGIGLMVLARDEADKYKLALSIANPAKTVRDLFDHMGLSGELPLVHAPVHGGHAVTASASDALTIKPIETGGYPGVHLEGRFTMSSQADFLPVVKTIGTLKGGKYVIELSRLTFMDSSGLSMIMVANDEARRAGVQLVLSNPVDRVKDLLHLAAVDLVMSVHGTP
ncbi:putative anti-sigma-factor antagonist [Candidatus Terasakiella magnetica]|nr:putative anti-sigma-factor antagonist [Candidatus Terasakiella magnetica]